jgi:undecaprenyl-diphosphatase
MTIIDAMILGLLQGLTEFLPVSSSGHLVLAQELLGISHRGDISFEVFVHFGTLLSVVGALRKDVIGILSSVSKAVRQPQRIGILYSTDEFFRLVVFILVGSVPAAVVGLSFKHDVELLFDDPKLVSVMLMVTGFVLYLTRFANPRDNKRVGLGSSIIIGCTQAFAIIPGISRSGSTISGGLFSGVSREQSAKFSFLLAVPAIFGAAILEVQELFLGPANGDKVLMLMLGTIVAAVSGYFAILLLLNLLRKRRFSWFAYYCFLAGILGVLFVG